MKRDLLLLIICPILVLLAACTGDATPAPSQFPQGRGMGDVGQVVDVIDGDTITVALDGFTYTVDYLGVRAPNENEVCHEESVQANRELVAGQDVRLIRDVTNNRGNTLLRYVFVGDTFVNHQLVIDGYAEVVLYEPDRQHHVALLASEMEAAQAGVGCHPTGLFNDGSGRR